MNTIADKTTEINFKSIKMKPKDIQASYNYLRSYASTDRKEFGQKAFEIFDKYISKEAKNISEKKNTDFKTVYDYLCKIFWKSLEDLKFKCSRVENYFKQICFELKYETPNMPKPKINKVGIQQKNTVTDNNKETSQSAVNEVQEQVIAEQNESALPETATLKDKNEISEVISEIEPLNNNERLSEILPEIKEIEQSVQENTDNTDKQVHFNTISTSKSKYRKRAELISLENKKGTSYRKIAKNEGVSFSAVRRASLIYRNTMKLVNGEIPTEIREKAQEFISVFGLQNSLSEIIKWLLVNPTILPYGVKDLENKTETLSKNLNVDKKKLAEAGIKSICVFTANPETTINNIDTTIKNIREHFGVQLNRKDYIKACLKQPQVFAYKPETVINKIEDIEKYLQDRNINPDKAEFINAWTESLWLLSNSIERTKSKLDMLFADNPSADWFVLKNFFKEVVYMDREKISNNISEVVREFEPYGLTPEEYENAVRKQKPLAKQNPQTIINKVKALSETFVEYGMSLNDCIRVCVKQPSLFYQSPDTIIEHINAYMYVYKNKYNQTGNEAFKNIISNCMTYSSAKIYLNGIIYPQVKNSVAELKSSNLTNFQSNIVEFFKENPSYKITIEIVDDEMKEHFIKTVDNFCEENIGRKVFNYKLVTPKDTIHIIKKGTNPYSASASKKKSKTTAYTEHIEPKQQKTSAPNTIAAQIETKTSSDNKVLQNLPQEYISAPAIKTKTKAQDLRKLIKNGVLLKQHEKRIAELSEIFELRKDIAYLRECFIKHSELFSMKLPVLVNNINLLAKNIELEDKNLLIECMLKNPMPFYHSPQDLENTIKDLLFEFGKYGLTKEKLLTLFFNKSSFLSSANTLINNLRANIYVLHFYDKEKAIDIDEILNKSITMPEANIYINEIIIPQISDEIYLNTQLRAGNFSEYINDYLKKHPLKEFNIKILNNHMADHFIEIMNEYSQKQFDRCIFSYTKCSRNKLNSDAK